MFTGAENSRSARLREQHHTCAVRPLSDCRCFEPPDLPRTQVWPCTSQHHEHALRRLRHCGSPALGLRVRPKGPAPSAAGGLIQAHQQAARPGDDGHHDGQDEANRGPHDLRGRTSSRSRICLLTCYCGCAAQLSVMLSAWRCHAGDSAAHLAAAGVVVRACVHTMRNIRLSSVDGL